MTKELEQIEILKTLTLDLIGKNIDLKTFEIAFEDIKSALERKEKLEKAWEIVKTHIALDCLLIKSCDTVSTYNNLTTTNQLTETEFNLLKEMLGE